MPRNEDGEFELVVGNKQLLSIVFILMVLFGVVFSMGYFVGRSTSGTDVAAQAPPAESKEPGRPEPVVPPETATAPPASEAPPEPGEAKVTGTRPSAVPATAPVKPAPAPTAAPAVRPVPPPEAASLSAEPQAGQTFLQVAAVKKPQAELLIEVLREKGFPALASPVAPGGPQYRVLVGPIRDASTLARTKADLEGAGFKPIVKRY
jgi:cell division protein FtsN